ncbi:MAG: C69 family dipeptidase, partial [Bacteroidales bacterium]|nr:C69 family dipeptidase [Bacteroidales bacterium]
WLPDAVGGLFWFAVDDAGTSALTPVYSASRAVSWHYALGNGSMVEYSPTSMFWLNNRIAQFAYLRYNPVGLEVQERIAEHERQMVDKVAACDAAALAIKNPKKQLKYLTQFSVAEADALFDKWALLDQYLLIKYMDGTVKFQNPDGSFKTNGSVDYIPVSPDWPGYTEKFKRAIVNDNGALLKVR